MEHLVNQPVADQGLHAEASQADDIVDLVQGIENLNKDDAIKRLLERGLSRCPRRLPRWARRNFGGPLSMDEFADTLTIADLASGRLRWPLLVATARKSDIE